MNPADEPASGWRKQPRQARAHSTIECILEATRLLLLDGSALTTNSVAARAGVSVGTFYQYFTNKEGLLQAWFEAELEHLATDFPRWQAPFAPTAARMAHIVCEWWLEPARRAAWRLLDDAARHPFRLQTVHSLLDAAWPDAPTRPCTLIAGMAGMLGALAFELRQPSVLKGILRDELALLLLAPHVWPTDSWREACELTPADLSGPSIWSRGGPERIRPLRQWMRTRPRQGRSAASVAAVIAAAGDLLEQGVEYSVHRLAERAGVSASTIYRYFADKHFAIGEFGIAQLARFTERMVAHRGGIYLDAPGAGVTRLVQQCLDPLRSRSSRAMRRAMFTHKERSIIDQQIQLLCTLLGPSVFQHPLCGVDVCQLRWVFHGVDGVAVWLTAQGGLNADPPAFGHLVEATSQMVFNYCATDRTRLFDVLTGDRPLADLRKPPGRL